MKILDFGLAKWSPAAQAGAESATLTVNITDPGTTVGTINYMSPEQARGEPNLAPQSDQFSFGLVLYELAAGKRAFQRASAAETMTAIIREEAEPLPGRVPAPLRWLIERLLAKEPAERYDSTRDLYRELKQIRDGLSQTTGAVPASATPSAVRRRTRWLLPALVGMSCLIVGFALALYLTPPSGPDLSTYKFTQLALGQTEERAPAWSPDGKSIAYVANVHGIEQVFARAAGSRNATQLTHADSWCWYPFWFPDGETIYYDVGENLWTVPASGGAAQLVLEHVWAASIHPDGKTLAFARDGKMWLAPLHGGSAKEFWPGPVRSFPFAVSRFSPDGSTLAVLPNQHNLWLLPYPSGKPRKLYSAPAHGGLNGIAWLPDGRSLVTSAPLQGSVAALVRVNVRNGSAHVILASASDAGYPSIASDGTRIAWSGGTSEWDVVEMGLADGAVRTLVGGGGNNWWPDWGPSGTHFLLSEWSTAGHAIIDREASGSGFSQPVIETGSPSHPRWSPDGTRLVFLAGDRPNFRLMLASASGSNAVLLDEFPAAAIASGPSWAPDGQWIAYDRPLGKQLKLSKIRPTPGASPVILADAQPWAFSVAQWSPAADWILYPAADGLDLISPDGKSKRMLTSRKFTAYNFSRDGAQVYGIAQNTTGNGAEWQLYSVNVKTGAEKFVTSVDFPASTGAAAGFSVHPDGKRALTAIARWPFQIWMLEGFDEPPRSWFARLLRR